MRAVLCAVLPDRAVGLCRAGTILERAGRRRAGRGRLLLRPGSGPTLLSTSMKDLLPLVLIVPAAQLRIARA